MTEPSPEHIWDRLHVTGGTDLPWSWDSNDEQLVESLSVTLVDFVRDYNATFVVKQAQLVPYCWPAHPGLAREIASLYSVWASAFHGSAATPGDAAYFYDRTLPGFQDRVTMWLGRDPDACRAGQHPRDWNDLAPKIGYHDARTDTTSQILNDYSSRLSVLISSPPRLPEDDEAKLSAPSDAPDEQATAERWKL
ncbi:hypothetical protein CLV47_11843 [Antricoccus suffuscus]|uniref:Uncharacterized protein n=1 Tax=Antricoccus suffuscus TaxID=1629062 RepID=A0A2T0ZTJ8_9ACTN|nr:hypothetical protein [Antricoccus suffuscus]PRZ39679.1 hypothetical protein CLV47_11843 [Antricoccus suffuscus]